MTNSQKQWLAAAPWESVLNLNKALCQAQKFEPAHNAKAFESARRLWENAVSKSMTLQEALDICRKSYELGPFTFNNGNTFAALGRTMVEDYLHSLPPVEAQIIRTTVAHYIVGMIGRRELQQVLRHFEPVLNRGATPRTTTPASSEIPRIEARA